jgi:hypothetical protein
MIQTTKGSPAPEDIVSGLKAYDAASETGIRRSLKANSAAFWDNATKKAPIPDIKNPSYIITPNQSE